ncbi:MAG: adenylate/guanylate cyclase domain-containing protein, partial [Anaerolineae bacterium]
LKVFPWPPGLLLAVTDTTEEALLLQRLTQERNEVALLQRHLQEANQRLNILLHRFASPSVAQQLLAQHGLPRPGGERRTVTALFVDMRGFTGTAEQMAPEAVMDLLNRHFDLFSRTVIRYEGTISHYAGDMMMVLFNAPQDQPDHALRAVQAGLEIHRSVRECSLAEGCSYGLGINTGPAMAGYLGFEERFIYTVVGDAVNVAARLSSTAMPGQILIGPQTYQMVRDHIRVNPIGPLRLKGKRTPVLAYEVVGMN